MFLWCVSPAVLLCMWLVALQEFPKDTQLMGGNDFYDKTVRGSRLQRPERCISRLFSIRIYIYIYIDALQSRGVYKSRLALQRT